MIFNRVRWYVLGRIFLVLFFSIFLQKAWAQFPNVSCTNQRLANVLGGANPQGTRAGTLSADGNYLVFESASQDIVPGLQNGFIQDVYYFDRSSQGVVLLSADPQGGPANGESRQPFVSRNGLFVVFTSQASNLDANDSNGTPDVFMSIPSANATFRVSTDAQGNELSGIHFSPSVSDDGNRIVFLSTNDQIDPTDGNGKVDVFLKVLSGPGQGLHRLTRNGIPFGPHGSLSFNTHMAEISADGNAVIFSTQTNLLGESNFSPDVFYVDLSNLPQIPTVIPVSNKWSNRFAPAGGAVWASISGDGKRVAFSGGSWEHVNGDVNDLRDDIFIWDRDTLNIRKVSPPLAPTVGFTPSYLPKLSFNGRWMLLLSYGYSWDSSITREEKDTVIYDLETNTFEVLSRYVSGSGLEDEEVASPTSNPGKTVSDDGRTSLFETASSRVISNHWSDQNAMKDVFLSTCPHPSYPVLCSGDGSSTACPNGAVGAPGCGCPSTQVPSGAKLEGIGFSCLSNDRFKLRTSQLPPGSLLAMVASFPNLNAPIQLGNGLKCVADPYYASWSVTVPSSGSVDFGYGSSYYPSLGALVGIPNTWVTYQAFYLDFNYSGPNIPVNSSNAIGVQWTQ